MVNDVGEQGDHVEEVLFFSPTYGKHTDETGNVRETL